MTETYYSRNKEVALAKQKLYRAANREIIAARRKKYKARNKETIAMKDKAYHSSVHGKQLRRDGWYRREYGITAKEYDIYLTAQNGACAICKTLYVSGKKLAVDHDHATGVVRGVLCTACNVGLGSFKDDPLRLEAAAIYLRKHKK